MQAGKLERQMEKIEYLYEKCYYPGKKRVKLSGNTNFPKYNQIFEEIYALKKEGDTEELKYVLQDKIENTKEFQIIEAPVLNYLVVFGTTFLGAFLVEAYDFEVEKISVLLYNIFISVMIMSWVFLALNVTDGWFQKRAKPQLREKAFYQMVLNILNSEKCSP